MKQRPRSDSYVPRRFVYEYVKSKRFYILVYHKWILVPELSGLARSVKPQDVEVEAENYQSEINPLHKDWGLKYVVVVKGENNAKSHPRFKKFAGNRITIASQQGHLRKLRR